MSRWRDLRAALARRFAAALAPGRQETAAGAAVSERPGGDGHLAANPALARVAAADPAEARRLLDAVEEALRRPASPRMRGGFPGVDAADQALLEENPLLGRLFIHDAAAALELLKRVKEAGGGRR